MNVKSSNHKSYKTALLAAAFLVLAIVVLVWQSEPFLGGKGYHPISNQEELADLEVTKEVHINDPELNDETLNEFLSRNKVPGLEINRCRKVTVQGLRNLPRSTSLSRFGANDTLLGDELASILEKMDSIEDLELNSTLVTELSEGVFTNNKDLRWLYMSSCTVTKRLLERCADHPNLEYLELRSCTGVDPRDFGILGSSNSLQTIVLNRNEVDIRALDAICKISTLRELSIDWIKGTTSEQVDDLKKKYPDIEISYYRSD